MENLNFKFKYSELRNSNRKNSTKSEIFLITEAQLLFTAYVEENKNKN